MDFQDSKRTYAELEELLLTKYGAKKIAPREAAEYIPLTYGGINDALDKFAFATDEVFCEDDEVFLLPSKGEKRYKGTCEKRGCILAVRVVDGFVRIWHTYGDDGDYRAGSEFYKEMKTFEPIYRR